MLNSPDFGRKGSYSVPQEIPLDSLAGQDSGSNADSVPEKTPSDPHIAEDLQQDATLDPVDSTSDKEVLIRGDKKVMRKIIICAVVLAVVLFGAGVIFIMATSSEQSEFRATTSPPSDGVTPKPVNKPAWTSPVTPAPPAKTKPTATEGSVDGATGASSPVSGSDDYADGSGASLLSVGSLIKIDIDGSNVNVAEYAFDPKNVPLESDDLAW